MARSLASALSVNESTVSISSLTFVYAAGPSVLYLRRLQTSTVDANPLLRLDVAFSVQAPSAAAANTLQSNVNSNTALFSAQVVQAAQAADPTGTFASVTVTVSNVGVAYVSPSPSASSGSPAASAVSWLVPVIAAGAGGAAVLLAVGGALVIRSRRKSPVAAVGGDAEPKSAEDDMVGSDDKDAPSTVPRSPDPVEDTVIIIPTERTAASDMGAEGPSVTTAWGVQRTPEHMLAREQLKALQSGQDDSPEHPAALSVQPTSIGREAQPSAQRTTLPPIDSVISPSRKLVAVRSALNALDGLPGIVERAASVSPPARNNDRTGKKRHKVSPTRIVVRATPLPLSPLLMHELANTDDDSEINTVSTIMDQHVRRGITSLAQADSVLRAPVGGRRGSVVAREEASLEARASRIVDELLNPSDADGAPLAIDADIEQGQDQTSIRISAARHVSAVGLHAARTPRGAAASRTPRHGRLELMSFSSRDSLTAVTPAVGAASPTDVMSLVNELDARNTAAREIL